tara:strand:- start:518 stop:763 length:246 start_codon:yes stop_codon:yes gene_type:complete
MAKHKELPDRPRPVLVKTEDGWEIQVARYSAPIGPRMLKRTDSMPKTYIRGSTVVELASAIEEWDAWLEREHLLAHGKKKK